MSLRLKDLEQEVRKLPPLPATVLEVMEALNRTDVDFTILENKIGQDPSLVTRVLSVANSPFYGFSGEISNLKEACLVLGTHTTRNIVLTAGVVRNLTAERANHLDLVGLWRHATATGVAARVLAGHVGADGDTAFTAGLLHDIGKMVLDIFFPKDYAQVLAHRDSKDCLLREAEREVMGFDHSLVGACVAARWSLPGAICAALGAHHRPAGKGGTRLGALVHVADIVARGLELGDGGDPLIPPLDPAALTKLGLDLESIAGSLGEIEALSQGAGSWLS